MANKNKYKEIELYLNNALNPNEKTVFEERLKKDESLQLDVDIYNAINRVLSDPKTFKRRMLLKEIIKNPVPMDLPFFEKILKFLKSYWKFVAFLISVPLIVYIISTSMNSNVSDDATGVKTLSETNNNDFISDSINMENNIFSDLNTNTDLSMDNENILFNERLLDDKVYTFKSDIKLFDDFNYNCLTKFKNDTIRYQVIFDTYLNEKKINTPKLGAWGGTPAYGFLNIIEKENEFILISCFHPKDKDSYSWFESSNGCKSKVQFASRTSDFIIFGVKISKSKALNDIVFRAVMENTIEEPIPFTGTTYSGYKSVYNENNPENKIIWFSDLKTSNILTRLSNIKTEWAVKLHTIDGKLVKNMKATIKNGKISIPKIELNESIYDNYYIEVDDKDKIYRLLFFKGDLILIMK